MRVRNLLLLGLLPFAPAQAQAQLYVDGFEDPSIKPQFPLVAGQF